MVVGGWWLVDGGWWMVVRYRGQLWIGVEECVRYAIGLVAHEGAHEGIVYTDEGGRLESHLARVLSGGG